MYRTMIAKDIVAHGRLLTDDSVETDSLEIAVDEDTARMVDRSRASTY